MPRHGHLQRATPHPASRVHERLPVTVVACAFTALALALYWGALRNPPVFDDRLLNDDFLGFYGASWFKLDLRWIPYATFGWTYDVFGKNWFWLRLGNVLLHAATSVALFHFLARLFAVTLAMPERAGRPVSPGSRQIAFFGALLFLLHPVAVYGVAYLVQRSIVMATLFGVLCLTLFLEGLVRKSPFWHLAAALAYLLAVFSKEHTVMLPAAALALAILVRGASFRLLRELVVPLALFAAIAALVTIKVKGLLGSPYEPFVQDLMPHPGAARAESAAHAPYLLSVINQGFLFFRYMLVWLIPYPGWMSVDIRPPFPSRVLGWPHTPGFALYLIYAGIAAALLRKRGVPGLLGFGLLYPWLLSLTEITTVRIQEPFVLYRSYLWMSGLPAILPALLSRFPARWSVVAPGMLCIALILSMQNRLDTFSSAAELWDDVVRKNTALDAPFVERGYHNLGFAYLQSGRLSEALKDFDKAIEINVRDADAYMGRGTLLSRAGNHDKGLKDLDRAIEIDPRYTEAYAKRCYVKMLLDRPGDARHDCEKAVALNPRHRDALINLGVVNAALGRTEDAAASYRRALAIDAASGDAHYNYGVLLIVQGRREEARYHLRLGCEARVAAACSLLDHARGAR
ncbi:MAG: tetratricopeptide repeat protein [Betaproteobacteria bacterium]|nr:tetratricopeptide repeat protein [Betaproteobacteria bacterium]